MTGASPTVLIFGDFWPDRLAASYERAFRSLGNDVVRCDTRELHPSLALWLRSRAGHRMSRRSLRLRGLGSRALNTSVLQSVRATRPDLALVLNGDFLMPETLESVRGLGTRLFFFHADNPFPPHAAHRPEHLSAMRLTDCYFTWSRELAARLRAAGARQVEYLPFAWDPEVFPFGGGREAGEHDVVFVGGWDRQRERLLAEVARHFDLKIWGPPYWKTRTRPESPVRRCWQGRAATQHEAAELIARSKVSLNILRDQNLPDGTNMRTFEVPGCGGAVLATRSCGAREIFPEGQAGAYFATPDECFEQITSLLGDDRRRQSMMLEAHRIVESDHRYIHRAQRILDVFHAI